MKNNNFKKAIRKIHLWLGLSSGLIVFIIAITGCLYAFQEEIQDITEEYRFVETQNKSFLPPSQLEIIARKEVPNKVLHAIKYNEKNNSVEAIFFHYEPSYHYTTYMNPYTGKVLKTINNEEGFFPFILDGHFYLWLPHEIGQTVVASATIVFLIMLISGLILWYPKNKSAAKQRFWFKWKKGTKWKRKNYDLHNVTGFYILIIGIIFAITGLVWGFQWFAYSYYKVSGGEKSLVYEEPLSKKNQKTATTTIVKPLDAVWLKMQKEYPQAKSIEIHPPETNLSPIAANANSDKGTYWKIDYRYFDQYSLEEMTVSHLWGRKTADKIADNLMKMNYDIHTGAILGLPGKIFAFLCSLLIASLPISGCYIWWGRNKKNKNTTTVSV
ncbi:MAG: PepSY-associated TM helix domain-containing protein [Flavobacterium sp.]|uniref:PepSY-associated TM helix domain-containing protein n=1 Tax=Flavobacterium sp. TaxID=239 RepID=UPI0027337CB7|nr:PepSY-associated TM helix domain-containing protein [Flavobacterium sp.]MDP3681345.1 PepSY-associated TM helix domain-containing protein [Flavobacterium sp.]MDZ4331838.1 PepSY-associated TM helix domain-containing protein [Flavobacterium sp.]